MPKYMFLIFDNADAEEQTRESMKPWRDFSRDAQRSATFLDTHALCSPPSAAVVSVREGKTTVTDGPFIDTKEQLGGYFVFDCPSEAVALEIAAKVPSVTYGYVEVRQIVER